MRYSKGTVVLTCGLTAVIVIALVLAFSHFAYASDWKRGANLLILATVTYLSVLLGYSLRKRHEDDSKDQWAKDSETDAVHEIKELTATANQIGWDGGFDADDRCYPEELDIALQAWRGVCNNLSDRPPREQLADWLNKTYPGKFGIAATERIVGVCNWDKSGGRPKSK